MILTMYDLRHLGNFAKCQAKHLQFDLPLWVTVLTSANHVFLVMNAAANLFLFMLTGTQVCNYIISLFINKRLVFNEMLQQSASKGKSKAA